MESAILDHDEAMNVMGTRATSVVIYLCWDCEFIAADFGRNSSHGPYCARCNERMEAVNIVGHK